MCLKSDRKVTGQFQNKYARTCHRWKCMCPFHRCHSGRTSIYPKILFPKMLFCFGKIYFLLVILCITLADKCLWYESKRINKQCVLTISFSGSFFYNDLLHGCSGLPLWGYDDSFIFVKFSSPCLMFISSVPTSLLPLQLSVLVSSALWDPFLTRLVVLLLANTNSRNPKF